MALHKLKDVAKSTFIAPAMAAAIAATSTLPFAAHAQDTCAPLHKTKWGQNMDAGTSAHIYSKEHVGAVGISIFPGQDLKRHSPHKLGTTLVKVMEMNGVEAQCFVHDSTGSNGTSVNFAIAGLAWREDGSLNVSQSLNKETLRGVIAEAKTAKMLASPKSTANDNHPAPANDAAPAHPLELRKE